MHCAVLRVELFFVLSGFILFGLYERRVAAATVSARDFAVLRLSRLYPLHLATLLVLLLQTSPPFVYPDNDTIHLVRQLFMVSAWSADRPFTSFNGPVWSVSVELLLYIAFFVLCRLGMRPAGFALLAPSLPPC